MTLETEKRISFSQKKSWSFRPAGPVSEGRESLIRSWTAAHWLELWVKTPITRGSLRVFVPFSSASLIAMLVWLGLLLLLWLLFRLRKFVFKPDFRGFRVWITGASSGIGEALAYEFARQGASLILSSRSQSSLERVQTQCKVLGASDVSIVPLDLENCEEALRIGKEIAEKQEVHILVHSAGLGQRSLVLETTTNVDLEEKLLRVNVLGPIALTKGVLPSMVERRRGHIVGINSVQGLMGVPMRAAYSASKFALKFFLWSLRSEFQTIRTTNIYPGYVRTAFSSHALSAEGQSTGVLDEGFQSGMPVERFAVRAVRAVYWQEKEVLICQFKFRVAAQLKKFCPGLLRVFQRRYLQRQMQARNKKQD